MLSMLPPVAAADTHLHLSHPTACLVTLTVGASTLLSCPTTAASPKKNKQSGVQMDDIACDCVVG